MTDEMIRIAKELLQLSAQYRELFEEENQKEPVIYIEVTDPAHEQFGNSVFICDSFNTGILKHVITKSIPEAAPSNDEIKRGPQ